MKTRKSLPIGLILLFCFSLLPISASSAQTVTPPDTKIPNFDCYRNAATITARMQTLAETYPDICQLVPREESFEGQSIYALEIGGDPYGKKPHFILLTGLHGNDFSQPELGLQLAEMLLEGYESNADLHWIVDNIELDLILLANPDGRQVAEGLAETHFDASDITSVTNSNNVDLEENFCLKIDEASEGCSTYTFEPETQAIINYLRLKLGEPIANQPSHYDSKNLFIYFSSHNKETDASDPTVNLKGKLRIPKFYTFNPSVLEDMGLINLNKLTELLRIFGSEPRLSIETYKLEGKHFTYYPVDFTYFSYGIASVELSAPPTYDSRPLECGTFTSEHMENYMQLLKKAAKSAAQPYKIGYGPIVDKLSVAETNETEIQYHAEILDKNQILNFPESNPITSVHYYIDQPTGTITGALSGWEEISKNPYTSKLDFSIPNDGLTIGKHILTLQACSEDEFDSSKEVCGLPLSEFLIVPDPDNPVVPDPTEPPDDPDPPNPGDNKIYLPIIGR